MTFYLAVLSGYRSNKALHWHGNSFSVDALERLKTHDSFTSLLNPAMDHFFGGEATATVAIFINHDYTTTAFYFSRQVVDVCLGGLLGIHSLHVYKIGYGFGDQWTHKVFAIAGGRDWNSVFDDNKKNNAKTDR